MKKLTVFLKIALLFLAVGAVFLGLCIFTDINDELFLPLALLFISAGNGISFVYNLRESRRNKPIK